MDDDQAYSPPPHVVSSTMQVIAAASRAHPT